MTESRTGRLKPHERTFTRVGVGMFRPIEVKRCRSLFKPHGVMFTCYGICAIHIRQEMLQKTIHWNFNPQTGPYAGPVKEQLLNNEALQTIFCESMSLMAGF